jgi:hypothetical protein
MWALMSELAAPATLFVIAAWFGWILGRHMPAPMHLFKGVVSRECEHNHVGVQTVAVQPQLVKAALHGLFIAETAHWDLPPNLVVLSRSAKSREDLRKLLVGVVADVAMSRDPRAAEAGRLLLDYYVKRVGSHEVVMERLHLSRPTFYRRLSRGLVLTADRLDGLNGTSPSTRKTNLQWGQVVGMRGEILSGSEWGAESAVDIDPKPRRMLSLGFLPKVAL